MKSYLESGHFKLGSYFGVTLWRKKTKMGDYPVSVSLFFFTSISSQNLRWGTLLYATYVNNNNNNKDGGFSNVNNNSRYYVLTYLLRNFYTSYLLMSFKTQNRRVFGHLRPTKAEYIVSVC